MDHHYSENTNIYPIDKSVDNSEFIDEYYLFKSFKLMNIICNLSTFNGIDF